MSAAISPRASHITTAPATTPPTRGSKRFCLGSAGSASTRPTTSSPDDRHIAVAIGRDYADVPPTRGVFKGDAGSELSVAVAVSPASSKLARRELSPSVNWIVPPKAGATAEEEAHRQQQQ